MRSLTRENRFNGKYAHGFNGKYAQPDQGIKKAPTRGAHSLTSTNPAADVAAFLISFRKFLLATAVSKSLVEKFWAIMSQVNGYGAVAKLGQ